jgi:hypothetical protein
MSPLRLPALLFAFLLAFSAAAQTPFPTDQNARLEELGTLFTVQGRQRIPRRVTLEAFRAIKIQGKGDDATLEVSGNLKMRAATGGKIEFTDVWLELTPECKGITLGNCLFKGKGGIRPSPEGPIDAKLELEAVEIENSASMTLEASGGSILMDGCWTRGPLVIRGVARSATTKSGLTLAIYGSSGEVEQRIRGLLGGLTIEGLKDGTIRTCDIAGPQALFLDNRKLALDGCNLRAKRVEFKNTAPGGFAGLDVTKNDFRAEKLVLTSPRQADKQERLTFETCYFRGLEDLATIRKELLEDAENSESGAVAVLKDIRPSPMGLAGTEK